MPQKRKFAVGQRVWFFDTNHREYEPAAEGEIFSKGGPIFEKHFREFKVMGIEGRSYLIDSLGGWRRKISFVQAEAERGLWYSDEGKLDRIWEEGHRYKVIRKVERATAAQLREIAKIVGYEAK